MFRGPSASSLRLGLAVSLVRDLICGREEVWETWNTGLECVTLILWRQMSSCPGISTALEPAWKWQVSAALEPACTWEISTALKPAWSWEVTRGIEPAWQSKAIWTALACWQNVEGREWGRGLDWGGVKDLWIRSMPSCPKESTTLTQGVFGFKKYPQYSWEFHDQLWVWEGLRGRFQNHFEKERRPCKALEKKKETFWSPSLCSVAQLPHFQRRAPLATLIFKGRDSSSCTWTGRLSFYFDKFLTAQLGEATQSAGEGGGEGRPQIPRKMH